MNLIKTLLLLVSLLFCINSKAEEVTIPINKNDNTKNRVGDDRSLSLIPTVTLNESTISIYSNLAIEYIQITVKDTSGNIVYYNSLVTPSSCHILTLNDLMVGEYILELTIGEESFYGYFSII